MSEGRAEREARAYDEGQVFAESRKLQTRFRHVFFCPNTCWLNAYVQETIARKTPGGVILDYGCFTGDLYPALAAHKPARVVGIDVSQAGLDEAKKRFGDAAEWLRMDAHHTTFPDSTFDLVVGTSILHHLDWTVAIREVNRILKPGGVALFSEPLGGNPAAKLMRKLTPKARTPDERPLDRAQIVEADRIIGAAHHRFGNLVSVPLAMMTSLVLESPDNALLKLADPIDRLIARTPLKYWMRSVVLSWEKVT
jgi:SAM-dependent methyltransferase